MIPISSQRPRTTLAGALMPLFAAVLALFALIVAVHSAVQTGEALRRGAPVGWEVLWENTTGYAPLFITCLAMALVIGHGIARGVSLFDQGRRLLLLLPVVLPIYVFLIALWYQHEKTFGNATLTEIVARTPLIWWAVDGVVFMMVTSAVLGLAYYRSWRAQQSWSQRLERELTQSRLEALRGRLEPHFMLNALNAISGLVQTAQVDAARRAIHRLGQLLRRMLDASRDDWGDLAEELAFAEDFLALHAARLDEQIRFRKEVDEDALGLTVPSFLLLPLVENAVRHGIEPAGEAVEVWVTARIDGDCLEVEVGNALSTEVSREGTGIGLDALRQRLRLLYGDRAAMLIKSSPESFAVRLRLPLEAAT